MEQVYELNIGDYIEIVRKRKFIALIIFGAVFFGVFVYTNFQTPMYRSTLMFNVKLNEVTPVGSAVFSGNQTSAVVEDMSDYTKQITSKPIVEAALKSLGKINDSMSEAEKNDIVRGARGGLIVTVLQRTTMVELTVQSTDPQFAAEFANKLFTILKENNVIEKNKKQKNVTQFIRNGLNEISKKLEAEENRLRVLITQGVIGVAENILKRIDELEQKRMNLLTMYTENYPDVMALTEEIDEMKLQLKTLPNEEFEYGVLKRNIEVDQKLFNELKTKLQESEIKEAEKIDNVLLVDNAVPASKPYYPNKKTNYMMGMLLGLCIAVVIVVYMEQVMETSIGKIEDIEQMIKVSVVGVIPFFQEKTKGEGIKWKEFLPFLKGKHVEYEPLTRQILAIHSGGSLFVEAFRILGTNIQVIFGKGGRIRNKVVLITSSNPQEGKSIVSCNLSITLAQMGYKTLLIDGDLRKPSVDKNFGFEEKSNGFTDILLGNYKLEEIEMAVVKTATDIMLGAVGAENVIKRPWMNNLHIITAGSVFPNPVNLLNSERLVLTLDYLKNKYDIVVLDTAPISVVSDTSFMLPKVDGVLLVYRAGTTSRLTLRRSKTQIESVRGKDSLNGLILNNVMPEISKDSYYHYHKDYHSLSEETVSSKVA